MSGESAVLGPVDRFLAVLDSSAYRKGLLFHNDALVQQGLEGVPGTVADR